MQNKLLVVDQVHPIFFQKLKNHNLLLEDVHKLADAKIQSLMPTCSILVLRSRFQINTDFLLHAPHLKLIVRAGSGMDNIDMEACTKAGVICLNTPEGNRDAVAEHALSLLLALHTKIVSANLEVNQGIWDREGNRGHEIKGKTLGIIGYGNCGSALAKKVSGLGMNVLAYDKYFPNFSDPFAKSVSLEVLQNLSDIVSLHIPLNSENEHFVNYKWIKNFKKNIVLLNLSRGKIMRTKDILDSLKEGKIKAFATDVLENENFSSFNDDEKNQINQLQNNENVLLTPHIAGWTFESYQKIGEIMANKIMNHLESIEKN